MDFMTFTYFYNSIFKSENCKPLCREEPVKTETINEVSLPQQNPIGKTSDVSLNELLCSSMTCRRKMKLWEETQGVCIYCGKPIVARDFVAGIDSDIEHIIPRSLGGYNQMSNLACSCRACNREKGDLTAIDYMLSKDSTSLQRYIHRIRILAISGFISEEKYYNLLHPKHMKIGTHSD